MKIGELAKKANISVDTLRYYEKIGLLHDIKRSASGYRNYQQHNVEQLHFIRNAQHSGFSLEDIAQLMAFKKSPVEAKVYTRRLAEEKVAELTQRIELLTTLRDELRELCEQCASDDEHCPIIDKFLED